MGLSGICIKKKKKLKKRKKEKTLRTSLTAGRIALCLLVLL